MGEKLAAWGGGAQLLRAVLAFGFPFLLTRVPSELPYTAPLVVAGVFGYIAARWLVLAEPATLRDTSTQTYAQLGEAFFVSVAVAVALTLIDESGAVSIGLGVGTVVVLVYLFAHALLLRFLGRVLLERERGQDSTRRERPNLRRFIRASAFLAGETVALMAIGLAAHNHQEARRGPWGLWDVVPISELVLLYIGYLPIVWVEMAATKSRSTKRAEVHGAIEASLLQAGAVVVAAFTGLAPWL